MYKNLLKLVLIIVSTVLFSVKLFAVGEDNSILSELKPVRQSSELKPHIGIFLGPALPEGSGIASTQIGIDIGYQPYIPIGVALEISHSRIDDGTEAKDRNTLWMKGTYNLAGQTEIIKDSYFGVGVGVVSKSDRTSLAFAPLLGFDIPMKMHDNKQVSFGLATRYEIVSDGDVDTLNLSGVAKYWF